MPFAIHYAETTTGAARAIEAFVTALSVAIAVALGLVLAGGANPL